MQLIQTIHDIYKFLDKKETADMAIFDFIKSFDRGAHKILIHKLNYYWMYGCIASWTEQGLKDDKTEENTFKYYNILIEI